MGSGELSAELSFVAEGEAGGKRVLSLNLMVSGSRGKPADLFFFKIDDRCYAFQPKKFLERFGAGSFREALLAIGEKTRIGRGALLKLASNRKAADYARDFFESEGALLLDALPPPLRIKL